MQYTAPYESPLGSMLLSADEEGLTGIWFNGQKYYAQNLGSSKEDPSQPALVETKKWLDLYFKGIDPDFLPPIHMLGSDFQKEVWEILLKIPFGKTMTYGEIAKEIAKKRGLSRMSAQAVGGAVGHNKISVLIPCHRVVGTNGSLTGYAGGIDKKISLLKLEGHNMEQFIIPTKGTAI